MVLLAINCGFGNADCGQLRFRNLDLANGWLDFPRGKTGVDRRCHLWPETIAALRVAIEHRAEPKDDADRELVFITKYGGAWFKDRDGASALGHEFRKLLAMLKLRRDGLSFYVIRHTFATEAGATRDQVAVNAIMGHADATMAGVYRERIDDDRLTAVTDHVHKWLFPQRKAK